MARQSQKTLQNTPISGQIDTKELAAAIVPMLAQQGSADPETQKAIQLLAKTLAGKIQRDEVEEEERREMALKVRKHGAQQMQILRDRELNTQKNCPHMKPGNAGSAIGGQRDHQGNYLWICQFCSKQWKNDELPIGLRIPMERVGGPIG